MVYNAVQCDTKWYQMNGIISGDRKLYYDII